MNNTNSAGSTGDTATTAATTASVGDAAPAVVVHYLNDEELVQFFHRIQRINNTTIMGQYHKLNDYVGTYTVLYHLLREIREVRTIEQQPQQHEYVDNDDDVAAAADGTTGSRSAQTEFRPHRLAMTQSSSAALSSSQSQLSTTSSPVTVVVTPQSQPSSPPSLTYGSLLTNQLSLSRSNNATTTTTGTTASSSRSSNAISSSNVPVDHEDHNDNDTMKVDDNDDPNNTNNNDEDARIVALSVTCYSIRPLRNPYLDGTARSPIITEDGGRQQRPAAPAAPPIDADAAAASTRSPTVRQLDVDDGTRLLLSSSSPSASLGSPAETAASATHPAAPSDTNATTNTAVAVAATAAAAAAALDASTAPAPTTTTVAGTPPASNTNNNPLAPSLDELYDGAFLLSNNVPVTLHESATVLLFNLALMHHKIGLLNHPKELIKAAQIYQQVITLLHASNYITTCLPLQMMLAAAFHNIGQILLSSSSLLYEISQAEQMFRNVTMIVSSIQSQLPPALRDMDSSMETMPLDVQVLGSSYLLVRYDIQFFYSSVYYAKLSIRYGHAPAA